MKHQWIFRIFGVTLALLCFSCTGFFEIEGEEEITPYTNPVAVPTYVVFNNLNTKCSADVFGSPSRYSPITTVSAGGRSNPLPWFPTGTDGYDFYLTYNFTVEGCKIPYVPRIDSGAYLINVRIEKQSSTTVSIPPLSNYIQLNVRLSNDIWLAIRNTGYSQLRIVRGTSVMPNEDGETTVDVGKTGVYKFDATAIPSQYKILVGVTETALPITNFTPGYLFSVTFNGTTASLTKTTELILGNM
jgi:hypothetical protein